MPKTATKPRLSRDEQKKRRAQELLDAAWEMFCEIGYEALSLDKVAESAGYSRMPIYSLFGDKQTLFFELWKAKSSDLEAVMLADCAKGAPLADNLNAVAAIVCADDLDVLPPRIGQSLFFVVQTISLNRPDIEAQVKELADDTIDAFAAMIENSTLPAGRKLRAPARIIAQHILAQMNGGSMVQFQTQARFTKQADVADIFLQTALAPK